MISGSARLTGGMTSTTPWNFGKLPRCTLDVWNAFTLFERLSRKAHYGEVSDEEKGMSGSRKGGRDAMQATVVKTKTKSG